MMISGTPWYPYFRKPPMAAPGGRALRTLLENVRCVSGHFEDLVKEVLSILGAKRRYCTDFFLVLGKTV